MGAIRHENKASIGDWLEQRHRTTKLLITLCADAILLIFAVWLAYVLRLNVFFSPNAQQLFLFLLAPAISLPIFLKLGVYRSVIRYIDVHTVWSIVSAMSLAILAWAAFAFFLELTGIQGLPRSIPFLFWLLAIVFTLGSRFAARWLIIQAGQLQKSQQNVLIYGVTEAGRQLAASLDSSEAMQVVGFINDEKHMQGKRISHLQVYARKNIPELIERYKVKDAILTLPQISMAERIEIVTHLEGLGLNVRALPAMSDIASGKHLISMIRNISIDDLLGRDPVQADSNLLAQCIQDKTVLVSGAGGSIGSELCKQIIALQPKQLILLEQNEFALYQIERQLHTQANDKLLALLGSVKDKALLNAIFTQHAIDTVYHAAAHKHVPLVEANLKEGINNNTFGTWNIAEAAYQHHVNTFVLISTDKAVRPTNVMGATKRWAELIIQYFADQAAQQQTGQRFCAVRFGNVLGSSGSVIPLFKEQIEKGGPITVTHPDIIRYFMSIHEAVELVIQAGSLAKGGDIFLLDMGEPIKINQLATEMIKLTGHTLKDKDNPQGDIEIIYTGLRPGEKLYEELLIESDAEKTQHEKIMRGKEPFLSAETLQTLLNQMQQSLAANELEQAKTLLMDVVFNRTTQRSTTKMPE